MNILQLEDDIKSLPDQTLMNAMQTGEYPQYLVLSELKRRKDMRDDHAGRMASYNKDNTVADKIMNEASMNMNAGLGALAPPSMQGMPQGMPQNMPTLPQDQGLGQMVPSNMQNMRAGGQIPSYQDGGGIPVALLGAKQKQSPAIIRNDLIKDFLSTDRKEEEEIENNIINLKKQNLQDMASGGLVEMQTGTTVPYTMMNPSGIGQFYDFYRERMQPTQAELDYQEMMRGYFDPEEMKKRNRIRQGLDLMRAGLAVGTSATPQQLSKNLDPVITSAASSAEVRDKEGLMQAKFESDIAKTDRERDTKIAELAYKSEQASKLGGYYDRMGSKDTAEIAIGKALAKAAPDIFGVQTGVDENDNPIYSGDANVAALREAGKIKASGPLGAARLRTEVEINEGADDWVAGLAGTKYVKRLIDTGIDSDEAEKRAKLRYIQLAKQGIYLDEIELSGGGQVPALPQDPPSLNLSSRF